MNDVNNSGRGVSVQRFERARRQANLEMLSARLTGRDPRLLPFTAVRSQIKQQHPLYRGVREIPLDAIVGSVGRYREFTRRFLPLTDNLQERWVNVDTLASNRGWPPIEVYQVGNLYFVKDGNHRTSVARQLDVATIEAHIWEFPENISLNPNESLDSLLIQIGEQNFFDITGLDKKFPEHHIQFTTPGRYSELLTQIQALKNTLTLIDGEEMPFEEAVAAWYEMVYLPTVQIIRDSTLLEDFPGRTEADLFAWLSLHRDALQEVVGESETLAEMAQHLADRYREGSLGKVVRQMRRLLGNSELPPLADPDWNAVMEEE